MEKRRYKRIKCMIPCLISFDNKNSFKSHLILDISEGGMFVLSDIMIELGKEIFFKLLNKNDNIIIEGKGIVVWSNYIEKDSNNIGFGVFFNNLNQEDKDIIDEFANIL